jgi:hypothetical protein
MTVYEADDVQLACYSEDKYKPAWFVNSVFQNETIIYRDINRRIYYTNGVVTPFEILGRYNLSEGNNFFNLTISKVNLSETGEYICHERFEVGNKTSLQLFVLGEFTIVHQMLLIVR